jgi:hypothetical protein
VIEPGVPPWVQGLHEDQPTQDEAMPTFPDTRHPAKQDRDEQGQIGDRDHSMQRQESNVGDKKSRIPELPLYHIALSTLIFKALLD